MSRKSVMKLLGVFGALASMFYAGSAMADTLNLFTPVSGDKSISMILTPIFGGDLFSSTGNVSAGSTTFEVAMGTLNGIALLIGGFLTFYTVVVGTMMTAHDGENMGRKWSSVWVPIRTALGTAMVMPVSSGYCGAQLLMGWLISQGIGAADTLWSAYVASEFSASGMTPTVMLPAVEPLAMGILKSEICMQTINTLRSSDTNAQAMISSDYTAQNYTGGGSSTIGRQYGSTSPGGECGKVFFPQDIATTASTSNALGITSIVADETSSLTAIEQAHISAVSALESSMSSLATSIISNPASASGSTFASAVKAYQTSVSSSAASALNSSTPFDTVIASAQQDGWLLAGSWFMKAASMQDQVDKMVAAVPAVAQPAAVGGIFDAALAQNYAALQQYQSQVAPSSLGIAAPAGNAGEGSGIMGMLTQKINVATTALVQFLATPNDSRNGIMSVKDTGDYLMTAGDAMIASGFVTKVLTDSAEKSIFGKAINAFGGAGAGTAASLLGDLLIAAGMPLILLGMTMAVYIPMLPFMIYFGTVIGWVILVAEAVVAAPLWGIMHLNPNGDEMAGAARQGYMMVLGLMLRPVLIVVGFIFASLAVDPLIKVFTAVFFPVFKASMGNSLIGVATMFAMAFIYTTSMFMLITRTFGFIHIIPDQLLRWIGGGTEQMGQYGGGMGEGSKAALGMMAGKATGAMQGLAGAARNAGQIAQANEDRAKQAEIGQSEARQKEQGQLMSASSGLNQSSMSAAEKSDRAFASGSPTDHLGAMRAQQALAKEADGMRETALGMGDTAQAAQAESVQKAASETAQAHYQKIEETAALSEAQARTTGDSGDMAVASTNLRAASQAAAAMGLPEAASAYTQQRRALGALGA